MKIYLLALITIFTCRVANAQTSIPSKIRIPCNICNYSRDLYKDDSQNFVADVIFGKREIPFRNAVETLDDAEETVAFDASVNPEEIFEYLEDPNKLYFQNGKAYIITNDKAHFLTEVELIGKCPIPTNEIRARLENFADDCISQNLSPDLISVNHNYSASETHCAVTAFKISPQGRTELYQRFNFCTVKIISAADLFYCFLNTQKCIWNLMTTN